MNKWTDKAQTVANETAAVLQTMYDALNSGQQKKVAKAAEVKTMFDRYGVKYTE